MKDKYKYYKHALNIFLIIFGTFIMGAGFNLFFAPNNILLGGFGGLSTIISFLLSKIGINISMSVLYLIFNSVLYIFAVKILGKTFAIYAIIGILGYSLFLEVCKFSAISNDLLLCCIYGSLCTGIGVGLVIRCGGSTGGGDMLGCVINRKIPKISVGWVTIFVNTVVMIISFFVYGLNLSLYSLIGIFISGKCSDIIIEGPKSVKAFYIISSKSEDISSQLINNLHRGVTGFEAYGKYSGNHLDVLLCLVSSYQIAKLKQIVYDVDKNAFLFSVSVKEAMGKGFHKLENRKSIIHKKDKIEMTKKIPEQTLSLTKADINTDNNNVIENVDIKKNINNDVNNNNKD